MSGMFDFGRDLRRAFAGRAGVPLRDGLTGGDVTLLDLLDLGMLKAEARGAAIAAGRVSAPDPARAALAAARVWRELARRTGDPMTLRRAAAFAESAAAKAESARRRELQHEAELDQAACAGLGVELFGDDGLEPAIGFILRRVAETSGRPALLAQLGLAALAGRKALGDGDLDAALASAAAFEAPLAALRPLARRDGVARLAAIEHRMALADLLAACGARLKDDRLLTCALTELAAAERDLSPDHEPLAAARLGLRRGEILTLSGELTGDAGAIADGVERLTQAIGDIDRDHSPLDWARAQIALGQALQAMGEATDSPRAFDQALACFDRAELLLRREPALALRAVAANARSVCLGRLAEATGDIAVLDAAEAALRTELTAGFTGRDALAWAVTQLGLARLYELRVEVIGRGQERLPDAAMAYDEALTVFAERGLRAYSDLAARGLERLRERAAG
jgi:tetratricopeptide (TPR) repeat protein